MLLSARVSLSTLIPLCRTLSNLLHSGVGVRKAFEVAGNQIGDARCRRVLTQVALRAKQGRDITSTLRQHAGYFPELFVDMVEIGEHSGALPEVLRDLAEHYEHSRQLRRTFLGAIAWPVIQLVAAILVIGLLIYILGMIADSQKNVPGSKPMDMLGLGLMGPSGAVIWLSVSFGTIAALVGGYFFLTKVFREHRFFDLLLLQIPIVGTCLRSFAIARFSWVFYLTQNAGMKIASSLKASLKATGNGAFQLAAPNVCQRVLAGSDLSLSLRETGLFPEEYLQMVEAGETSGTVPETLHRLSPEFTDQARRSLATLTAMFGWLIWLMVAALIIFIIFSIMLQYIGQIQGVMDGMNK